MMKNVMLLAIVLAISACQSAPGDLASDQVTAIDNFLIGVTHANSVPATRRDRTIRTH